MSSPSPRPVGAPVPNVFVLGPDDFNWSQLQHLPGAGVDFRLHRLLDHDELRGVDHFPVRRWVEQARERLEAFDGDVDAIVSFWDFPVTETRVILCQERGLPSPTLEAVLRCQHKYWSRLQQQRCLPECTPAFEAVEPFDDDAAEIGMPFPFWLKPVRSFRSHLGFHVDSPETLRSALGQIREQIERIGDPLEWLLDRVDLPPEVAALSSRACIAEQLVGGSQCTLEGYSRAGRVRIYGIVDSVRADGTSSFARYQYPSQLPGEVQRRMIDAAVRMVEATGYDGGAFNVEFFHDPDRDDLWLLEVNCRISQSHAELFKRVDGVSHHQVMIDLALGREPQVTPGGGDHAYAAKCFLRRWHDGVVERVPGPERIAEVERWVPDTTVRLDVEPGDRLSDLPDQDSYSYELGHVYVAGDSPEELLDRFRRCEDALGIEVSEEDAVA